MQWMKVSAQLWRHPKWSSVSPQAKALWVTAASWCCENDTFGDVSFQFLSNFSQISRPNKYALELVEAGLWEVADNGYRFHDWDDHNVSKTAWEQGKAATRERVKKHREKKSNTARNTVSNAVTPSVSNAESNDAGNTVPFNIEVRSKKDISKDISLSPLPPSRGKSVSRDYTPEFEAFWDAYGKHGNKHQAFTAFTSAIKRGHDPQWLTAEAAKYTQAAFDAGREVRYRKHASTWLNNDGWEETLTLMPTIDPPPSRFEPQPSESNRDKALRNRASPELPPEWSGLENTPQQQAREQAWYRAWYEAADQTGDYDHATRLARQRFNLDIPPDD